MRRTRAISQIAAAMAGLLALVAASGARAEQAERCEIPAGTQYAHVPPEVTVYSDRSRLSIYLSTVREQLFLLKSLTQSGDLFVLELFADGMPLWVAAPRADLWRYRFSTANGLAFAVGEYRLKHQMLRPYTARETLPCLIEERRAQARLLFEKGYAKLLVKAPDEAEKLFREGLELDSENAAGIFYWGHTRVLIDPEWAIGSYEAFREALSMGLPPTEAVMARAHVRNLEQRKPCYKEWYEALPNLHLGSCL